LYKKGEDPAALGEKAILMRIAFSLREKVPTGG
jgi:hypothetical protein